MPSSSQSIRRRTPYCCVTDLEEENEVANLLWCYTEAPTPRSALKAGQPAPNHPSCSKSSRGSRRTSGVSLPPAVFPPALVADVLPNRPERIRVSSFGGMPPMDHPLQTIDQNRWASKPIAHNPSTLPPASRSSSPLSNEYSYHEEVSTPSPSLPSTFISLVLHIVSATFAFFPLAFFKLASFVSFLASCLKTPYHIIIARRRTSRFGYNFGMKRNRDLNPFSLPADSVPIKQNLGRGPRKLALELADPSALPLPPISPVKIDLKATFAFGSLSKFPKLLQHFSHENVNYDPEQEYINAGNVPPTVIEHRLYWQGRVDVLPEVMNTVLPCLLNHLTITECNITSGDVISLLSNFPSLRSLDIRDIRDAGPQSERLPLPSPTAGQATGRIKHRISSLTLTSHSRLSQLFRRVEFKWVTDLSLRLFDDGNDIEDLFSSVGPRLQSFRLRGHVHPEVLTNIRRDYPGLSFGHMCNSTRPRQKAARY